MEFKPQGYNSLSPYLMVTDGNRFLEMATHIFGATLKRKYLQENGRIMHAEIQIDDSILMFSEATDQYPAYSLWLHVYVPNAHEVYTRAIEYGCESLGEPEQKPGDPDYRGSFRDMEGINWSVSTQQ